MSAQLVFLRACKLLNISFSIGFRMPLKSLTVSRTDLLSPSLTVLQAGQQGRTNTRVAPVCYLSLIAKAKLPKLLFDCMQSSPSPEKPVQGDNRYLLEFHCLQHRAGTCGGSGQSSPCTSLFPGRSYLTLPADNCCKMHIPCKAGFQHSKSNEIPILETAPPPRC